MIGGIRLPNGQVIEGQRSEMHLRRRHALVASSMDLKDKTVLDVGCNNGLYALYMAASAEFVYGIDRFRTRINEANALAKSLEIDNVRFITGDIRDEALLDAIGNIDVVVLWGFLHRVPDIFSILYSLSKITNAFSLEWQTPVFPGMSDMPIAIYPETRDKELGNLTGLDKAIIDKGDDARRMMQNAFWEPTPAAVKSICCDLGLEYFRIIGYDDRLVSEERMLERRFDKNGMLKKDLPERKRTHPENVDVARVHVVVERSFGVLSFKRSEITADNIPDWDIGMKRKWFSTAIR